ncbi:MAG: lipid A deacylase LpxR family protein [Opitutae bacterium]|nr:lipid A deacylase LpxR family protein [Opitutae bacterium]
MIALPLQMRYIPTIAATAAFSAVFTCSVFADTFSVADEDDYWGRWSDKYYTNHTRLAYTLGGDNGEEGAYFFTFGQEMYSPKDHVAPAAPPNDHPYAGFIYVSAGRSLWEDNIMFSTELQVGAVGRASMAHGIQRDFHHLIGEETLNGWDSQVPNQPGINLLGEVRTRFVLAGEMESGWGSDLICRGFAELGTVRTMLSAGAQLRFGYNLPKNFGYTPMRQSTAVAIQSKVDSIYAFWDFEGDAMIYDVTLGGELLRHFDTDIQPYPFAFQSSIGIEIIYGHWTLTIYQSFRTKDFSEADHTFSAWGGVKISFSF